MGLSRSRTAWIHSRRGALAGASAAVVCLGALLGSCGGGPGDGEGGYVAIGAAGAEPERPPGKGVAPTGEVEMVPLSPGASGDEGKGRGGRASKGAGAGGGGDKGSGRTSEAEASKSPGVGGSSGESEAPNDSGGTPGGPGSPSPSPTPTAPDSDAPREPAVLKVADPVRKALEERWCEKVTLEFRNTGGTAVRSGTVTFGTHIIGALGIDWATVESTRKLPVPIAAGETEKKSWKVCVDAWRVPLGMHIETRDVSVKWK